jgi:glyoxylase-like metal-dependent hydrolase (beta-lactamase superfamily II)
MTLDGTHTFIIGDRRPVVIDPGPDDDRHLAAVLDALAGVRPTAIVLTHRHPDHAELSSRLAATTGVSVLAYPDIAEGDCWSTDAGEIETVELPGHTEDHVGFLWRGEGAPALFVGDAFMGGFDTVLVAPPEGDLTAYLAMLDRVEALAPATLYPAHGPAIQDGASAARRYRAHRMQRIEQVIDALRGGSARPEDLVGAIYGAGLHPELRLAAAGSIQAVVEHLERTGRAATAPDGRVSLV